MKGKAHKITSVNAREILDSRGNPTLSVTVHVDNLSGQFDVPSGASTGVHEAWEKRDGDKSRFNGKGVQKTVQIVKEDISSALKGRDVKNQKEIDDVLIELDGTENKSRLGANAILGASIACAKAAAKAESQKPYAYLKNLASIAPSRKTPYLYLNLINAGKHASSYLAFQEYMIVPQTDNVEKALVMASQVKNLLRKKIVEKFGPFSANYGDEGGIVIQSKKVREPFEILTEVITELNLKNEIKLAIDAAASSFFEEGQYIVDEKSLGHQELLDVYKDIIKNFNVLSIEDPFHEEDFENFAKLLGGSGETKIVGDDLTVTNSERLKTAIEKKSINAIIIKPNQIGTLSETLEVMKLAKENNVECIVSHRSGETSDDFIADLAYAFGTFGLKAGAPNRGERVAKYNRLWEIAG